jgi:hypothetical protein
MDTTTTTTTTTINHHHPMHVHPNESHLGFFPDGQHAVQFPE